jgi:hypothetical protein
MWQGFYFLIRVRRIYRNNTSTAVTSPLQPVVCGNTGIFTCNFFVIIQGNCWDKNLKWATTNSFNTFQNNYSQMTLPFD